MSQPNAAQAASVPEHGPENFADFEAWRNTGKMPDLAAAKEPAKNPSEASGRKPAAETDPNSEPGKNQQEPEDDEETPRGLKKRFHKLTSKIRDLELKLAGQQSAAPAKPEGNTGAATPEQPKKSAEDGKPARPKVEDFDSYDAYEAARDKYVEDLSDWKAEQREKSREAAEQNRQATEKGNAVLASWNQSEDAAREKHEDYDDAIEAVAHIKVPGPIQLAILESDLKAELAYHLAKNPAELERIVGLSPAKAAIELGKIEARLTPAPEPEKTPATRAPKPPTPVGGRAGSEKSIDDPDLSFAEFEKRRNAQLSRR